MRLCAACQAGTWKTRVVRPAAGSLTTLSLLTCIGVYILVEDLASGQSFFLSLAVVLNGLLWLALISSGLLLGRRLRPPPTMHSRLSEVRTSLQDIGDVLRNVESELETRIQVADRQQQLRDV